MKRVALLLLVVAFGACRQDMHDQAKLEPYEASPFFADGRASRRPPTGTVARGQLKDDALLFTGLTADGKFSAEFPFPIDRARLDRGRERFDIYCSPCHGRLGDGAGMIVRRGFKAPKSFHDDRLRAVEVGYFFDVMSKGFGQMSSYAAQIPVEDRWAIAAYVRALQLSRNVPIERLAPSERVKVEAGEARQHARGGEGASWEMGSTVPKTDHETVEEHE